MAKFLESRVGRLGDELMKLAELSGVELKMSAAGFALALILLLLDSSTPGFAEHESLSDRLGFQTSGIELQDISAGGGFTRHRQIVLGLGGLRKRKNAIAL